MRPLYREEHPDRDPASLIVGQLVLYAFVLAVLVALLIRTAYFYPGHWFYAYIAIDANVLITFFIMLYHSRFVSVQANLPIEVHKGFIRVPTTPKKHIDIPDDRIRRIYPYYRPLVDSQVLLVGGFALGHMVQMVTSKEYRKSDHPAIMVGLAIERDDGKLFRLRARNADPESFAETREYLEKTFPKRYEENRVDRDLFGRYGMLVVMWGVLQMLTLYIYSVVYEPHFYPLFYVVILGGFYPLALVTTGICIWAFSRNVKYPGPDRTG